MGKPNQGDRVPRMKVDKKQMKSAARLYAVQALFQMESSGQTVESVTNEFETHRFGAIYDEEEITNDDEVVEPETPVDSIQTFFK